MIQPDTDSRSNVFKTSHAVASAIVLSFIFSFIIPMGVAHAAECIQTFCAEANATGSNPLIHTSVPISLSLTNTGNVINNTIVDIEIYDENNIRIHQHIVEQQYLPTNGTKIFSTSFTPKNTGVYTVKVGVFGPGWSNLYYWTDTAGSIKVITALPTIQIVSTAVTPSITSATIIPQSITPITTSVVHPWWPTDQASLMGPQPFKAVVDGKSLSDYTMYWQVDNGQLNIMNNSYAEAPHKEMWVDVSSWNWRGNGPYVITFVAKNSQNIVIAKKNIIIYTEESGNAAAPTQVATTPLKLIQQPIVAVATTISTSNNTTNPLAEYTLYVNSNSPAKNQADTWRANRPGDAAFMDKIAAQSQSQWFGNWNDNIGNDVKTAVTNAKTVGQVPVLVAYNVPQRDCGGYSGGGANDGAAYKNWIQSFADGIGSNKAIIILEPDALAHIDCLSEEDKQLRMNLISFAISTFKAKGNVAVYVDAGHASWIDANTMSERLKNAGIDKADGFSLNVSNYITTANTIPYGERLSKLVSNKHFVIDTSRNGLGPNGSEWCNPSGRALGQTPTTAHSNSLVDALLWIKAPGESDGNCGGGPGAGQWWGEYALGLAQKAGL